MRRREFITLVAGATAKGLSLRWRSRPIGCVASGSAPRTRGPPTIRKDELASRVFAQGLREVGVDRKLGERADRLPLERCGQQRRPLSETYAAELVALAPDVILASASVSVAALLLIKTRTVPIVFVNVIDPVGAGFVASQARPGGNATGFSAVRIQPKRKMARTVQRDSGPT